MTEKFKINTSVYENKFTNVFINDFVRKFRVYNLDEFNIRIDGLKKFISKNDSVLHSLLKELKQNNFIIEIEGQEEKINFVEITCNNITNNTYFNFNYQIQNLSYLVDISSKTNISVAGLIISKIIAHIICKIKIIYKAIVLDLDNTLWFGTISEDGIDQIKANMVSEIGAPYIEFMNYVKILGDELGIYIAICSRNDTNLIDKTINNLDSNIFPLKNHVDLIIANHNDKSDNIRIVAEQLSILPNSIVFIDDNQLVRDEVKNKLPEVFVPNWKDHFELVKQLIVGCIFERIELSINSQSRRKQNKILISERKQNSLPELMIKVNKDNDHIQSKELYSKSNQFKLVSEQINYSNTESLYFEIFRKNGENLGICSTITYSLLNKNKCVILNWAISCRYFEVGLEEWIILYLMEIMENKEVYFAFQNNEENKKVHEFISNYNGKIIFNISESDRNNLDVNISQFIDDCNFQDLITSFGFNKKHFNMYLIKSSIPEKDILFRKTNLKLI